MTFLEEWQINWDYFCFDVNWKLVPKAYPNQDVCTKPTTTQAEADATSQSNIFVVVCWWPNGWKKIPLNQLNLSAPVNTPAVMWWAGTTTVSAITTTWATLWWNIANAGSCAIVENGFVIYPAWTIPTTIWSANVTKITTATVQSGNISAPATWLNNTSNYCFKPYATNCTGTTYWVELCFTTLTPATAPIMWWAGTTSVSNITTTSADLTGTYTGNWWSPITWSWFVIYPSWNASTIIWWTNVIDVIDWILPSPISASATGLTANTNYCFKPYATNAIWTSYGVEVCFTTLNAWPNIITIKPLIATSDYLDVYANTIWPAQTTLDMPWNITTWAVNISPSWIFYATNVFTEKPRNIDISLSSPLINKTIRIEQSVTSSNFYSTRNDSWYDMSFDLMCSIDWWTSFYVANSWIVQTMSANFPWSWIRFNVWLSWLNVNSNIRFYIINSQWYSNTYRLVSQSFSSDWMIIRRYL